MGTRKIIAAGAAALALAGCGGSGGGSGGDAPVPITDRGVTVSVAGGNLSQAQVLPIQGNTGRNALYVEEGTLRIVLPETAESTVFTRVFRSRDGSAVARLTTPVGLNDLGFLRLEYTRNGVPVVSQSVFGRATVEMPTTGTATYRGNDFAQVTLRDGGASSDLSGDAVVAANFGTGRVSAFLDFRGTPDALVAPIDLVEIGDMQIAGSGFSGGTLTSRKDGAVAGAFTSPTGLDSSGMFGGPGAAEAGGVFIARFPGDRLMSGRYLAPRQ